MSTEREFLANFHGHSTVSDGLNDYDEIISTAKELGIVVFGLSEHHTKDGIKSYYKQVYLSNGSSGDNIIPVTAVEARTSSGDAVFFKVGELDHKFLAWLSCFEQNIGGHDLVETTKYVISEYGAFVVPVHLGLRFAHSISFNGLRRYRQALTDEEARHVGVEVVNWFGNLIFWDNKKRETEALALTQELGFRTVGGSDAHTLWQFGGACMGFKATEASADSFNEAFLNGNVEPRVLRSVNPLRWIRMALSIPATELRYRLFMRALRELSV